MKKRILSLLLAAAFVLSLAACGTSAGEPPAQSAAGSQSGNGDDKPADAGELVVYTPNPDAEINAVIPAFEAATGIKVIVQSMATGDVLARLDAEKENPQADINWGAVNYNFYMQKPNLYMEYVSPNDKNLPEQFQNKTGNYTNSKLSGSGAMVVNLDVCKKLNIDPDQLTGYKDLLVPELKGQIVMADPSIAASAWAELTNMLLVMGDEPYDEKAWGFVEAYAKQVTISSGDVIRQTADGEYAVCLTYEGGGVALLDDGATNLKVVYPEEGAVWLPSGVAIVKNCKNVENAKKFVDFLISEEGQKCYAKTSIRPILASVENESPNIPPFSELNVAVEDIEYCSSMKAEWLERWADLITQ